MDTFSPYVKPIEIRYIDQDAADTTINDMGWALSNFTLHSFVLDGMMCASMEGFLQSLKYEDKEEQRMVCAKHGVHAKYAGRKKRGWMDTQTLHWRGYAIKRESPEFNHLITRAFDKRLDNPHFRWALYTTIGHPLKHSIGKRDKTKTVLTEQEFIFQLERLRTILIENQSDYGMI